MKKVLAFVLALLLAVGGFCGSAEEEDLKQTYEQEVIRVMRAMTFYAVNQYYIQTIQ